MLHFLRCTATTRLLGCANRFFRGGNDGVWREAVFLLQFLQRSRGTESFHSNTSAGWSHILSPAERGSLLNRNPRLNLWRQHAVTVGLVLFLKYFPRRHTHDPCLHPFR